MCFMLLLIIVAKLLYKDNKNSNIEQVLMSNRDLQKNSFLSVFNCAMKKTKIFAS